MTTITQVVTTLPAAPDPATMTRDQFNTAASAYVIAQKAMVPEFNTWAGQVNTVAGEVNTNATTATTQAGTATTQAGIATTQAGLAAASAASALTAPGTQATSTTSLAIATGSKSFTIQTGKAFSTGQAMVAASDAAPATDYMWGSITSYNSGTGALVLTVTEIGGSGTHTDWTLSLSPSPAAAQSSGISTVVTATTATTLTSTPTLLQITPASYGVRITLPDATTCTEGGPLHIIDNKGVYPVLVCNSAGTLLGFVNGGVVSHISLIDNATAAGVWSGENFELVGASAQFLSANFNSAIKTIALDSDRDFIIGTKTGTAVYGKVHRKSTNSYSADTIIRNADCASTIELILQATNQVLVISCTSGSTAFEAVICSVDAGTDAITPNAAATATLSANISAFADGCGLIAVGTSFITSYTVATPAAQIREITVSGTTPTISAATVLDGTAGGLIVAGDATHVIAASNTATAVKTKAYTINGLAAGTGTSNAFTTSTLYKFAAMPGGGFFLAFLNGDTSEPHCCFVTLSGGNTSVANTVSVGVNGAVADAIVVSATKVLILNAATANNCNIITDSAGTASAGTAITLSAQTVRACLYVSGTDVAVQEGTTTYLAQIVDCSGASPVLGRTIAQTNLSNVEMPVFSASNAMLVRSPNALYGTAYARSITKTAATVNFASEVRGGVFDKKLPASLNQAANTAYRGKADNERWLADAATVITKVECVA